MSIRLSRAQRLLVVGIAAAIAWFLLLQIEEDGLDEAPWLVGLLVIGALLLVAFSSGSARASQSTAKATKKGVEVEFLEVYTQVADFLKVATASIVPLELGEMRSELLKHADEVGLKLAYAVHWLAIARQAPEAQDGPEAKALLYAAAGHLTETIANQLRLEGITDEVRMRAVKASAKELTAYRLAAAESAKAFAADQANPMDSLYKLAEQQLPLGYQSPEARESFYGPKIREQWRRLEGRD